MLCSTRWLIWRRGRAWPATYNGPLSCVLIPGMNVVNIAAYRFVALDDLPALRERVRERAEALALKGTVLLAPEGINLFLAGTRAATGAFLAWLHQDARFAGMEAKQSLSGAVPFGRLRVRLKREIITLRMPALQPARQRAPGVDAPTLPPLAVTLSLPPVADAGLPKPSERTQKPGTFAGYLRLGQIPGGIYTVSVSDSAWVDVIQDGNYLKPTEFSGVTGCNGIRKTMKFSLAAGSTTVQISGVAANAIKLAVVPSSD